MKITKSRYENYECLYEMWNVLDDGSDLVRGKCHGHQIIVAISICTNQVDWLNSRHCCATGNTDRAANSEAKYILG